MKIISALLFLALLVIGVAWLAIQNLPAWYQAGQPNHSALQLSKQIEREGLARFWASRLADVTRGEIQLNQTEFNALMLASLKSSRNGRRILSVSDAVNTNLTDDGIEFGLVVDLQKAARQDAKTRRAIEKIQRIFPLLDDSHLFIGFTGTPIARNGEITFAEDMRINIGSIPLSRSLLESLGVPVQRAEELSLPIRYLTVQSPWALRRAYSANLIS